MPKELQKLTKGVYTLEETEKGNQFLFYRNDQEVLGNVGTAHIELFSEYIIGEKKKGTFQKRGYEGKRRFEISNIEISKDGKVIRITAYEQQPYNPNLRIVKSGEKELASGIKRQLNFFKRVAQKMFGVNG